MKKLLFILLIANYLYSCSNYSKEQLREPMFITTKNIEECSRIAQTLLEIQYGISYDKKDIPLEIIRYLADKYPDNIHDKSKSTWSIANPNEKVNLGCTVLEGIPTPPKRQLIAFARRENYCVLHYLQGGFATHEEIIVLQLHKNKVIKETKVSDTNLDFMKTVTKLH